MKTPTLVLNAVLVASLTSLTAFADLKPIQSGTKADEIASTANGVFNVKQIGSGNLQYKLVTMDTVLNGDVGTTSILLTGEEVGGEAGYDSAFLLSPRGEDSLSVMSVSNIEPAANGVKVTYSDGEGATKSQVVKFDGKTKTLKESAPIAEKDCSEVTATNDVYQCLVAELTTADANLNAAYAKAKKATDATGAKLLLASEKAWIALRDAQCALDGDQMRGGTYEKVLRAGCKLDMTKKRTEALSQMATMQR